MEHVSNVGSFCAGSAAACMAVTFTNPIEVVKTRLQLQGELSKNRNAPKIYKGLGQSLALIYRTEGIRGLQRGLMQAYIYQIMLNGCRLGLYDPTRREINELFGIDREAHNYTIGVFTGAITGMAGAFLGSPFYLIKTRMQSYSPGIKGVGEQTHYNGTWDGLKSLYKKGGIRHGLFRGLSTALIRTGAGSSVQLPIYNYMKTIFAQADFQGPSLHLCASIFSGIGVAVVMNPFDVMMTRMYNQKGNLYKGPLDCLIKTVKIEGPLALYKGLFAQGMRVGPHTVLTLMFMEQTIKAVKWAEGVK